jgi:hypothetical protein
MIGGRVRGELVEGCVKEALGIFVSTLAAADKAEVCDHLSLVLVVPELLKDGERLVEKLNGYRNAAGGMNESEGEVVERQRLGPPVTELAQDCERGPMLCGGLFVLALAPKLRPALIESKRVAVQAGRGCLSLTSFRRARAHAANSCGIAPVGAGNERLGRIRSHMSEALQALLGAELVEPRLERPGSPLDR